MNLRFQVHHRGRVSFYDQSLTKVKTIHSYYPDSSYGRGHGETCHFEVAFERDGGFAIFAINYISNRTLRYLANQDEVI